jgi:iron complex transport system substrate-binding protein
MVYGERKHLSRHWPGGKLRCMNKPLRIASLISSSTEILYLLGLDACVVGVSHECDYPPQIAGLPRLTRSLVESAAASRDIDDQVRTLSAQQSALYAIDAEQLASLAPDLIITQAQCDVCAVRYEDVVSVVRTSPTLKNTQVLALNPSRLADVLDDIRRIGAAAAVDQRATEVIRSLTARVDHVRQVTSALSDAESPRVACLEWIDPPMLAANWTPELVAWAGGNDGLSIDGRHSSYADWDAIARFDPEVVVILPCGFDVERAVVEAQVLPTLPQWNSLAAVRNGRVYAADGNAYFNRSGPRLVDSLEILARLFHPTLFAAQAEHDRACRRLRTQGHALIAEQW